MQKYLLFFCLLVAIASAHVCIHEEELAKFKKGFITEDRVEFDQSGAWEPIRVTFDHSRLQGIRSQKLKNFIIKQLCDTAQDFFQKTYKVQRLTTNNMARSRCNDVTDISEEDQNTGIPNSDLHFYTIFKDEQVNQLANASPCSFAAGSNRPIIGRIQFNLYTFRKLKFENAVATLLHEMTHVTAVSSFNFKRFAGYSSVDEIVGYANGRTIIKTPRVLAYARKYFNCNSIQGVPIEDQGGRGSKGSHWERTVLHNEALTASDMRGARYSMFTLLLHQDSGWYKFNKNLVQNLQWGKGAGCAFVKQSRNGCYNLRNNVFFCKRVGAKGCTYDFDATAFCYGGDPFGNNCPYFQGYSNGYCTVKSQGNPANSKMFGTYFGPFGKCFRTKDFIIDSRIYSSQGGSCFRATCSFNPTVINVKIAGNNIQCRNNNQRMTVPGFGGYFKCPQSIRRFCKMEKKCKALDYCYGRGYCRHNAAGAEYCQCYPGFGGNKCQRSGVKGMRKVRKAARGVVRKQYGRGAARRGNCANLRNRNRNCNAYASRGMCTNGYQNWMARACPKACCDRSKKSGRASGRCGGRRNRVGSCTRYAKAGYCTKRYTRYMRSNCSRSCCLLKIRVGGNRCAGKRNFNRNCPSYANRGFCKKSYTRYMRRNCSKSCCLKG